MEYLHTLKEPILHKDLKVDNILLFEENGVYLAKLSDFGLSRIKYENMNNNYDDEKAIVRYKSPEQHLKKNVDKPADVYCFGGIIFECNNIFKIKCYMKKNLGVI
jgi:serine/threonine protein kinase